MNKDHSIERRIYYHDTDSGGVVYYANYFHFLEEGRVEFLRCRDIDVAQYARQGIVFPVVHVEVKYKAPARYGDCIQIFTRLEHIGNTSMLFAQEIRKTDALVVEAKTTWVCTGSDFKPQPVPDEIRKILAAEI